MSAGGLSYGGLSSYGGIQLQDVSGWGTNMNIVRDPPKSITTRRVDKVGDTTLISEQSDAALDRVTESILFYPRGQNPAVEVSFSNYGNGGLNSFQQAKTGQTQGYLPNPVNKDGAFRPPVLRQEQLMPLSRQPRLPTTATTKPVFVDYSVGRVISQPDKTREVHQAPMHVQAKPRLVFDVQRTADQPYEVKYVADNPVIRVTANAGHRARDLTTQHVAEPVKGASSLQPHASATANYGSDALANYGSADNNVDTGRFMQDALHSDVQARKSRSAAALDAQRAADLAIRTQDVATVRYSAPKQGHTQVKYIHKELERVRVLPLHAATSNKSQNIHKHVVTSYVMAPDRNMPLASATTAKARQGGEAHITRDRELPPSLAVGGFDGGAVMPTINRMSRVVMSADPAKRQVMRKAAMAKQARG